MLALARQRFSHGASHHVFGTCTFEADSHGTWSVKEVAEKKSLTMAQVALAWVLSKDGVAAPTVGATSLESLHELISELCWIFF